MKRLSVCISGVFLGLICFGQSLNIVVPYRSGYKWGYSDTLGKIKIPAKYDTVSFFDYKTIYKGNHVIAIVKFNGKQMAIDEKGNVQVPPTYKFIQAIQQFSEPSFFVSNGEKFGVITKGKEIFPPVYDFVDISMYGHFKVHKEGKYGLINEKGKIVIPLSYDDLREKNTNPPDSVTWEAIIWGTDPEIIKVKTNLRINRSELILPPEIKTIPGYISSEYLKIAVDSFAEKNDIDSSYLKSYAGIIFKNKQQGVFLPAEKNEFYFFSKTYKIQDVRYFSFNDREKLKNNSIVYIVASINDKYGIINEKEEVLLPFEYDAIEEKDGFFQLKKDNKIGFCMLAGSYPVIQPAFDKFLGVYRIPGAYEQEFSLFHILSSGKAGFVGENGLRYFNE